jgi:hypothetical protein
MQKKDQTETTAATKTSSTIDEFEKWSSSRVAEGHFLVDVTAAYTQTFPGRTVELIVALYAEYAELDKDDYERPKTD